MLKLYRNEYFVNYAQIDEFWCGVVELWLNSWLWVVVVVVRLCSHKFMLWVLMKVLLWLSCVDFVNFVKIGFLSKSHFRWGWLSCFNVEISSFHV